MTSSDLPTFSNQEIISLKQIIPKTKAKRKYIGILFAFLASLSSSFSLLCVKLLNSSKMDTFSTCMWSQLGVALPATPLVLYYTFISQGNPNKSPVFEPIWPLKIRDKAASAFYILVSSLVGTTGIVFRFYALQFLSVGDTSAITFSSPALVTFFAHCCLGESCRLVPFLIAFFTLGGVVLVTKPPLLTGEGSWDSDTAMGTSLAFGSLIFSALKVVFTRQMRKIHFSLVLFVYGWVGLVQALALSTTYGSLQLPKDLNETSLVLSQAVLSFAGQTLMTLALKFEQAGPIALVRSFDIVLSFLIQFFFLGVNPDVYSAVGSAIVVSCVVTTAVSSWLYSETEDSKSKL